MGLSRPGKILNAKASTGQLLWDKAVDKARQTLSREEWLESSTTTFDTSTARGGESAGVNQTHRDLAMGQLGKQSSKMQCLASDRQIFSPSSSVHARNLDLPRSHTVVDRLPHTVRLHFVSRAPPVQ